FAPLDDHLGLASGGLSPGLARACALAGAEMPYASGVSDAPVGWRVGAVFVKPSSTSQGGPSDASGWSHSQRSSCTGKPFATAPQCAIEMVAGRSTKRPSRYCATPR